MCSLQALPRPPPPSQQSHSARKELLQNHVARRPAWAQCADFHCNVTVQVTTTMRKWTLAHGGEIGAKDMSTLWWQKIEYLNWGPDGMCTPWAGGSLHSWNPTDSLKRSWVPIIVWWSVQFTHDRHPKRGLEAHSHDWAISSRSWFQPRTLPQDLSLLPSLILPYFSKFHFPDVPAVYLCIHFKGMASLFLLILIPCAGNDYVPTLTPRPLSGDWAFWGRPFFLS